MKIVLFGATGWIGNAIGECLLQRKHPVTAIVRPTSVAKLKIPAATIAGTMENFKDLLPIIGSHDAIVFASSADGTTTSKALTLLKQAKSIQSLVYISGSSVYGDTGSEHPATEEFPLDPDPMVAGLPSLEQEALQAISRGYVFRGAGILYGRRGGATPSFLWADAKKHGKARYIGDGNQRWSAVHVDDLAQLVALALESKRQGGIYNAVTHDYSMQEVSEGIATILGEGTVSESATSSQVTGDWGAFWSNLLSSNLWLSGQKAMNDFGWTAQKPRFLDDLREFPPHTSV